MFLKWQIPFPVPMRMGDNMGCLFHKTSSPSTMYIPITKTLSFFHKSTSLLITIKNPSPTSNRIRVSHKVITVDIKLIHLLEEKILKKD